jgi:hypothetical protein
VFHGSAQIEVLRVPLNWLWSRSSRWRFAFDPRLAGSGPLILLLLNTRVLQPSGDIFPKHEGRLLSVMPPAGSTNSSSFVLQRAVDCRLPLSPDFVLLVGKRRDLSCGKLPMDDGMVPAIEATAYCEKSSPVIRLQNGG